jgi:hypothetical protein
VFVVEKHYTDGSISKQILASKDFKVLKKVEANNADQPAWVVQRK